MRKILCFVMLLFAAVHVYGQWGVKAGGSFTKFADDPVTMKGGFYVGGFYDFKLSAEGFYLRPGMFYEYDEADALLFDTGGTRFFSLHYLKVPLQASYHIAINENNAFTPYVGGYMDIGLSGMALDLDLPDPKETNTYDHLDRINYGLTIGVEYELKRHFLFHLEYNLGLNKMPVYEAPGIDAINKSLNTLCVGVGYKF